jgi:glycosyltransferase involved in cell wall biosynthesis
LPKEVKEVSGKISEGLKQVQPDLLHAGPLHEAGYEAARSGFRPLVLMSWGSDILWSARRNILVRRRVRAALRRADVVVGDCASVRQAINVEGIEDERIITFPWGVDLERFKPGKDAGLRGKLGWQDKFVLLHLRSMEALYDPLTIARAFVYAAAKDRKLRLLMLGGGSLQNKVKSIFADAGVAGRVHMPGTVSQEGLPAYYHAADLYLSASLSDGSSVSLMEALACGLPAAVSDIPGNREWIEHGREGWFFPAKDADGLAELMFQAADSVDLEQLCLNARKRAEAKADWLINKQALYGAYDLAMENAR